MSQVVRYRFVNAKGREVRLAEPKEYGARVVKVRQFPEVSGGGHFTDTVLEVTLEVTHFGKDVARDGRVHP
jgi:hypothetical protein